MSSIPPGKSTNSTQFYSARSNIPSSPTVIYGTPFEQIVGGNDPECAPDCTYNCGQRRPILKDSSGAGPSDSNWSDNVPRTPPVPGRRVRIVTRQGPEDEMELPSGYFNDISGRLRSAHTPPPREPPPSLFRSTSTPTERIQKDVSGMKKFDAAVTAELQKLRATTVRQIHPMARRIVEDTRAAEVRGQSSSRTSTSLHTSLQSSKSWLRVGQALRLDEASSFQQAVEKLARAEAACHFDGAVKAAEAAAEAAPPELREEAALEGARNYQAKVMDSFRGKLPGPKPVEIVGYIGITGPK